MANPGDLDVGGIPAGGGEPPTGASDAPLPSWLVKELRRAGVADAAITELDEESGRDLVAEIRAEELD